MNIILDTQVLVYATESCKHEQNDNLHWQARKFVEEATAQGKTLWLPAIVMAEYLAFYSAEHSTRIGNEILNQFRVLSFDARCAFAAGRLMHGPAKDLIEQRDTSKAVRKRKISADCQIIATAIACSADVVISHDEDLHRLGKEKVKVEFIPQMTEQLQLPTTK